MKITETLTYLINILTVLLSLNAEGGKIYLKLHHQDKYAIGDGPVDQEVIELQPGGRWEREMNDYFNSIKSTTDTVLKDKPKSQGIDGYDWNSYRMYEDLQTTTPRGNTQADDGSKFALETYLAKESSMGSAGENRESDNSDQVVGLSTVARFDNSSIDKNLEKEGLEAFDVIKEEMDIDQHSVRRVKRYVPENNVNDNGVVRNVYTGGADVVSPVRVKRESLDGHRNADEPIHISGNKKTLSFLARMKKNIMNSNRKTRWKFVQRNNYRNRIMRIKRQLFSYSRVRDDKSADYPYVIHYLRVKRNNFDDIFDPNHMFVSTTPKVTTQNPLDGFEIDESDIEEGEKKDIQFIIKMIFVTLGVVVVVGILAFLFVKNPQKCIVSFGMGCPCIIYACPCIWRQIEGCIDPTKKLHEGINMYMPGLIVREDKKVEHYTPTQEETDAAIDLIMELG